MRQVLVITCIAAMLLLAACAGTPRHAPLQGHAPLQVIGAGRRQAEGSINVCGRLPSVGMGTSPGLDGPCIQRLSVPVIVRHPEQGLPRVTYRGRPCWCGNG